MNNEPVQHNENETPVLQREIGVRNDDGHVYWSVLLERSLLGTAVDALLDVAAVCGHLEYTRLSMPYARTDSARNRLVASFMSIEGSPHDTLVMLDGDHEHPAYVVQKLASFPSEIGVIGALYFRRGEPFDPLFFFRHDGVLRNLLDWEEGMVYEADAVATGGIAIKRWVFQKLLDEGAEWPFFRYEYLPDSDPEKASFWSKTEDIVFAELCEKHGIRHFCDTGLEIPHLRINRVTREDWERYKEANPEAVAGHATILQSEEQEAANPAESEDAAKEQ